MGFTKLDEGILRSSIMAKDSDTFKVWIALLASCDYDGIARVSAIFLSSVCHLPIKIVEKALFALESPDKHSRSTEDDGRRIKRVSGGYFVINYAKYRGWTYSQKPDAIRQRRHRAKRDTKVTKGHDVVTVCDPSASASASSSSSVNKNHKVSLPEWLPQELFNEYKKMRKTIRKPMTDKAVSLAVKLLEKLKSEGNDPKAVLEQSILNSWQGLFPLKDTPKDTLEDERRRGARERADEIVRLWVEEKDESYRGLAEEILEKRKLVEQRKAEVL